MRALMMMALLSLAFVAPANAQDSDVTACGVVSQEEAENFIGGPLQVIDREKIKTSNGEDTYDSICTYLPTNTKIDAGPSVERTLDVTLHVLSSAQEAQDLLIRAMIRYRQLIRSRIFPYPDATVTLVEDLGKGTFVMEAVTGGKTGYKTALIAFAKGRVGGTISAWNKPNSSRETTEAVLRHILSNLP